VHRTALAIVSIDSSLAAQGDTSHRAHDAHSSSAVVMSRDWDIFAAERAFRAGLIARGIPRRRVPAILKATVAAAKEVYGFTLQPFGPVVHMMPSTPAEQRKE